MPQQMVNADYTLIPDKAEVWVVLKSDVTNFSSMIPTGPDDDLAAKGWERIGYIDDEKGIPVTPSSEIKKYNAFGHRNFRGKVKNGELESGFTAIEVMSPVVKKITLQGSAPNKIGPPRNVQVYVLYRVVDEDIAAGTLIWCTLTPAPVQVDNFAGFIEGERAWYEMKVYHTTNADGDTFQVIDATTDDVPRTVTIGVGTTAYTLTVDGQTTSSLTLKTKAAVQAALRLLSTVAALPAPGVTVDGPDGGPLVATFTDAPGATSASGTGGTVTFA